MRICIPIRAKSLARATRQIADAHGKISILELRKKNVLFEIWLDAFAEFPSGAPLSGARLIAVCRSLNEQEQYLRLENAVINGAQFVDIDVHASSSFIKKMSAMCRQKKAKLIISNHFWKSTPDVNALFASAMRAREQGAHVVKIATQVKRWSDNVTLFELTKRLEEARISCIVVGMGERGKISRVGCPLLGSWLTYVAISPKTRTAAGQPLISELASFDLWLFK